jgi:tRNA(Glu) U13 pseudouridine synthase TruD
MLFSFKQKSQDFIVEEELPFKLSGKWDAFFVYFEKRNLTTMEIIEFLCKELNISRLTLGFAWLKDKDAITRQRVSIYKSALNKLWWEKHFINTLAQKTRILETSRNEKPIGMTSNIKNTFHIRLRALKKLSQAEIKNVEQIIPELFEKWFPNIFGSQRFWIEGKNRKTWKEIIEWKTKIKNKFELKFKLQSYASWIFNQYLYLRTKKWIHLLDGDILQLEWNKLGYFNQEKKTIEIIERNSLNKDNIQYPQKIIQSINLKNSIKLGITWPVVGYNILCPIQTSKSWSIEKSFLENNNINKNTLKIFAENKIFWIRRNIRTWPQKAKYRRNNEDILIDFTLDSWVYASVFVNILIKALSKIGK